MSANTEYGRYIVQTLNNYLIWQDEILALICQKKSMMEVRGLNYDSVKVQTSMSDTMPSMMVSLERLEDKIQRLLRLQDEILAGINDLSNKRYGKILTYRYVVGMTWDEIADSLDISPRWARRLCQRAELRYYKGGN